jgi:hypothetical protein
MSRLLELVADLPPRRMPLDTQRFFKVALKYLWILSGVIASLLARPPQASYH